jgi:hypothetical protein
MSDTPTRRWATREQAAAYAAMSIRAIDELTAQGLVTVYRLPPGRRRVAIDLNQLDRLIEAGRQRQPAGRRSRV